MALHLAIIAENTKANIAALTAQTPRRIFYTTDTDELYYSLDGGTTRLLSSLVQSVGSTNTVGLSLSGSGQLTANVGLSANADNILVDSVGLYVPDLKIAAGSAGYLSYNSGTRELSINPVGQIDVVVGTEASLSAWVAANYTGSEYQEGDIVILPNADDAGESWVHNGGSAGTAADFSKLNLPSVNESYIRSLFSANNGLIYNNSTGAFAVDLGAIPTNDLSFNGDKLFLDVSASDVTDTSGLVVTAGQDTDLQSLLDALAAGAASSYVFENGLTETSGTVKLGGSLTGNTTVSMTTRNLTFSRTTGKFNIGTTGGLGTLNVSSLVEIAGSSGGVILASPNGTKYKITVENDGALNTALA